MNNYSNENLLQSLKNRYAVKKFDSTKKIPEETVNTIIESVRLTPTSYGLQLMKLVLVESKHLKEELVKYSYGQTQVTEASHLIVLCRENVVSDDHVSDYINDIADLRQIDTAHLEGFKNMMLNSIHTMDIDKQNAWMRNQVYIALGNLLTSCAVLGIDACPMEGFIPSKYTEILQLDELSLHPCLVIPIGYRSIDDKNASLKKVRRSMDKFLIKR